MAFRSTVQAYLPVTDSSQDINRTKLALIRSAHAALTQNMDATTRLSDNTLRSLADQMQLSDDPISLEYLKRCVQNPSEDDACRDLLARYNDLLFESSQQPGRRRPPPSIVLSQTPSIQQLSTPVITTVENVESLTCIIRVKQNAADTVIFTRQFLFQQPTNLNAR
jgi:hypothetical protein